MPLIVALFKVPAHLGYPVLALLVGSEASGVPVPGETALIASAILASNGSLSIELVIAIAAAAAIVGDSIGYLIGARFGRRLLERPGRGHARRVQALRRGDELFARHGAKAVFFGRWVAGLRVWASWLAGMTTMHYRRFLFFHALGGICWATCFGLLGYFGGRAAAHIVTRVGLGAAIAFGVALVIGYAYAHRRAQRRGATKPPT